MSDTRLILHVKGTEAETKELPRDAVKTAIAEGSLSYSQLIWSPLEQSWKQARELPDLLPRESLILHVKGTESQTRELPKQAVKNAISRGEITHSQLIWSTSDSAWKPVRELPDLLPGETMILHVKGTESETRQLPKPAIRAAISKGEITHSQLIWSPLDSAWKPVSQMPELMPGESLILHVKGTEAQTTEMPKKAIRTAISKGQITHSQLIWSAAENQWKQVRELPELLPSQKLAPAPTRAQMSPPILDSIIPESPQGPVARAVASVTPVATPKARPAVVGPPRVKVASMGAATPQVKVASDEAPLVKVATATSASATPRVKVATVANATPSSATPQVKVAAVATGTATPRAASPKAAVQVAKPQVSSVNSSHVVKDEDTGAHPLKWVCIGLGIFVVLLLAANFLLVHERLKSNFAKTNFADVSVYSHYGAFLQPNVIVIHIPASQKLTADNFTDVLVALAHSTPENMLTNDLFERVALTSGWTAQYSFSGYSWKQLGDMEADGPAQRKEFIMAQISDARGDPLMPATTLNEEAQEAEREKVWNAFVAHFTKP